MTTPTTRLTACRIANFDKTGTLTYGRPALTACTVGLAFDVKRDKTAQAAGPIGGWTNFRTSAIGSGGSTATAPKGLDVLAVLNASRVAFPPQSLTNS